MKTQMKEMPPTSLTWIKLPRQPWWWEWRAVTMCSCWVWPHFKMAWFRFWGEWRGRSLPGWVVRFPETKSRLSKRDFNIKEYKKTLPPPSFPPSTTHTKSEGCRAQWAMGKSLQKTLEHMMLVVTQGCILLAAVGEAMKPLKGNSSRDLPLGQLSRGPLSYASPTWSQQWVVRSRTAQLPSFQAWQTLRKRMLWAVLHAIRLLWNFTWCPLLHPLFTSLHVSPEGTPQSITQVRISTSDFSSWEPSLRWLPHKEGLLFILRLENGPCHLSDIVIAFWNQSKSVGDSRGLDVAILRILKNLAKRELVLPHLPHTMIQNRCRPVTRVAAGVGRQSVGLQAQQERSPCWGAIWRKNWQKSKKDQTSSYWPGVGEGILSW